MNEEILKNNVENLISGEHNNNKAIYKKILKNNKVSKRTIIILFLIAIILVVPSFLIGFNKKTIYMAEKIFQISNGIAIPVFAVVFTGYAIFQALSNGKTLKTLLSVSDDERSKFEEYNDTFLYTALLYLILIIMNFIILIFLVAIPSVWSIPFFSLIINNIIAFLLIWIYLIFNIYCFLELKSFVLNLYKVFILNAVANGIHELKKDK